MQRARCARPPPKETRSCSVPDADGGIYTTVAGRTARSILEEAAEGAAAVLAVGACAHFGSVQSAEPNPTGALRTEVSLTLLEEGLEPVGGLWGLAVRLVGMGPTVDHLMAEAESNWIRTRQPEIWRRNIAEISSGRTSATVAGVPLWSWP